jgi:hypothetical protein
MHGKTTLRLVVKPYTESVGSASDLLDTPEKYSPHPKTLLIIESYEHCRKAFLECFVALVLLRVAHYGPLMLIPFIL